MCLEPAFFVGDVGVHEVRVRFSEVDNPFYNSKNATETTGDEKSDELDDAFLGVAEVELMNSEASEKNAEDAGNEFFLSTWDEALGWN